MLNLNLFFFIWTWCCEDTESCETNLKLGSNFKCLIFFKGGLVSHLKALYASAWIPPSGLKEILDMYCLFIHRREMWKRTEFTHNW